MAAQKRIHVPDDEIDPRYPTGESPERRAARLAREALRPRTLIEMIAAAGFLASRVNSDINERNYPLAKEGFFDPAGLYLFGGEREWTINEVKAAVAAEGGRLEGLVRGLAYLKANPKALKDGPIVFPASSWVHPHGLLVPYAFVDGGEPSLVLLWVSPEHRWRRHYRFLVSRKSST